MIYYHKLKVKVKLEKISFYCVEVEQINIDKEISD